MTTSTTTTDRAALDAEVQEVIASIAAMSGRSDVDPAERQALLDRKRDLLARIDDSGSGASDGAPVEREQAELDRLAAFDEVFRVGLEIGERRGVRRQDRERDDRQEVVEMLVECYGLRADARLDNLTDDEARIVQRVLDRSDWRSLRCPRWCGAAQWHGLENLFDDLDEDEDGERTSVHGRPIGDGYLSEVRRAGSNVTRPGLGIWDVMIEGNVFGEGPAVPDSVVRLALGDYATGWPLLPGEARSLAAALVAAADRLDLIC